MYKKLLSDRKSTYDLLVTVSTKDVLRVRGATTKQYNKVINSRYWSVHILCQQDFCFFLPSCFLPFFFKFMVDTFPHSLPSLWNESDQLQSLTMQFGLGTDCKTNTKSRSIRHQ